MTRQGVVFLLVAASPILSQQPASKPAPPVEMTAHLHDGSTIRKVVLQQSVELVTKHGTLTVPVADIRRIEFGLRLSKDETAEIDRAIVQLASDKVAEREAAGKKLVTLGCRAYPALKNAAASTKKDVAARATAALDQIRATTTADQLRLQTHDVIHTTESVLSGAISATSLKAKTPTFGNMDFKLAELASLQVCLPTTEIKVGAGTLGPGVQWHDTGIRVEANTGLVIRASGEIDLQAENGGPRVVSGPDGCVTAAGPVHLAGTLVGKIGDQNDYFVVGDNFAGRFKKGGKLYLWVVPWQKDAKSSGFYRVNVATGRDLANGVKILEVGNREPKQLEALITAKRLKRDQLSKEIAAWTQQMQAPNFNPNDRVRYLDAIAKNQRELQALEKEIRTQIGLHPAEWLERANPIIMWNGSGLRF